MGRFLNRFFFLAAASCPIIEDGVDDCHTGVGGGRQGREGDTVATRGLRPDGKSVCNKKKERRRKKEDPLAMKSLFSVLSRCRVCFVAVVRSSAITEGLANVIIHLPSARLASRQKGNQVLTHNKNMLNVFHFPPMRSHSDAMQMSAPDIWS